MNTFIRERNVLKVGKWVILFFPGHEHFDKLSTPITRIDCISLVGIRVIRGYNFLLQGTQGVSPGTQRERLGYIGF